MKPGDVVSVLGRFSFMFRFGNSENIIDGDIIVSMLDIKILLMTLFKGCFINDEKLMPLNYIRFIENSLRKTFDFAGTPLKLDLRQKTHEP